MVTFAFMGDQSMSVNHSIHCQQLDIQSLPVANDKFVINYYGLPAARTLHGCLVRVTDVTRRECGVEVRVHEI